MNQFNCLLYDQFQLIDQVYVIWSDYDYDSSILINPDFFRLFIVYILHFIISSPSQ